TSDEKACLESTRVFFEHVGVPTGNAKKMAADLLGKAISEGKAAGTYDLPRNFGDQILAGSSASNPKHQRLLDFLRSRLGLLRGEGVRDEDIKWWWNITDVERRCLFQQDENSRLALFIDRLHKGATAEDAAKDTFRYHPNYGDPNDESKAKGADRPLPDELKDRVNKFILLQLSDPSAWQAALSASPSLNALLRSKLKGSCP
ncbi:MAG TPA: hypothetical protein VK500_00160, partial [Nitrospiraceae bacterium]|nr:hypothetical protein [Nitrospiraceae bacterium]